MMAGPHCRELHPPHTAFGPMTGLAWSPQPAPSRPEGAVRHAHPLAIQQAGVGAAVSEKLRTIRARLLGPPGTPRAA